MFCNGKILSVVIVATLGFTAMVGVQADEFSQKDLANWEAQFQSVVKKGRALFTSGQLGSNGVSCAQCHPNGTNTHPETYPKFQKQLGKVGNAWEMINWCIENPLKGKKLKPDSADMIAIMAYITYERRGVKLAPGKH